MRSFKLFIIVLVLLVACMVAFWTVRATVIAQEAAEYAPAPTPAIFLPAGTAIPAVVWGGVPQAAAAGDGIIAFVETVVVVDGRVGVPQGAQLKGTLDRIEFLGPNARINANFTTLRMGNGTFPIESRELTAILPVQTDFDILGTGFGSLMDGTIGLAIGAGSHDVRLIRRGIVEGVRAAIPSDAVNISVVLARPANLVS